ncbi:MAG TPA: MFS transporter [Solirubrobacteraceae bacterium]|nr:MFS transporter [Solirubrobacteraceae bacterium]
MSSSAAVARVGGSRRILIIASLAAFMAFLDMTIVNIAFPALEHAFRAQQGSSISWVLNAYNIVFAALLLPAGQLADRYSRRKLFLLGLALFTLASGCCAISPTLAVLIGLRMIQAVGAAILIPTGMALLLPAFAPGEQIKAIALLAAVSGVAFAAGPSVGGILIHTVGWQGIFLINVPIGILTLGMAARMIGEPQPQHGGSRFPDVQGALLVLLGVGLLALAIVQGNSWGWIDTRTLVSFLAAGCLIAVAIARARRHVAPAIELDLFRERSFAAANLAIFAFAIGLAAKLLCDVLFMTSVWHYSELKTGLAVSASPLVTAMLASGAARVAMRIGERVAAALGGALYAGGCLWYVARMAAEPHYLTAYLPGTLLTGSGIALILPTLTSTAMLSVPLPRLAAGAGVNSMIRQLGAVLGIALFVAVVGSPSPADALGAFHHGWALAAVASALAALATAALLTNATGRGRALAAQGSGARLRPLGVRRP